MDSPGENTAQYYPQIRCRAEFGPHDGTEDRAGSRNVEKLYHIDFPSRHRNEIHAVSASYRRGFPGRVDTEHFFDYLSINEITDHKCQKADKKRDHWFSVFRTANLHKIS